MNSPSQQIGYRAESNACQFLIQQGLQLLHKNYRCTQGEIDLIMKDEAYTVFVEVRLRHNTRYGSGIETITQTKQQRIIKTAFYYLQQRKGNTSPCRFDVIEFSKNHKIQWIKNAFEVQ